MKNKFILFLSLIFFISTIKTEEMAPMFPVVTYIIGEKITWTLVAKAVAVLGLFGYCFHQSRKQEQEEALDKLNEEINSSGGGSGGNDNRPPKRKKPSTSVLAKIASILGFFKSKKTNHNQPVFKNGQWDITYDVDGHKGGFWKLFKNDKREGTYDMYLKLKIDD